MIKLFKRLYHQHLFRDRGISPTRRLLYLYIILAVPALAASLWGLGWPLFFALNFALVLLSIVDLWSLFRRNRFTCTRTIEAEIERGRPFEAVLQVANHSRAEIQFSLIDTLPSSFSDPFPLQGKIAAGQTLELPYSSQASVRGEYTLDRVYFRYQTGLALWQKQMVFSIPAKVRVIPDMSRARGYLATAQKQLIAEGLKAKHKRMGSGEFAQIQSYVPGDDPRKINWRQTAKLLELMTNVYEPEHGKYVTLLIDCGRIMGVELAQGNRLERAVEAALTLAAVALQQGDYVSVLAFSNEIKAYIPPGKRLTHLRTILQGIYGLQVAAAESDYAGALLYLATVQKRQGFVLMFSDLDPFLFETAPFLQRVGRKYRFLLLGISDPMTSKWVKEESIDVRRAMIKSASQREALYKKQCIRRWARLGVQLLEVPAEQLAAEAVSHYIDIINRAVL